ncbi:alpha/beta fold hydrolase [Nocardiopsis oceani]
MSDGGGRRADTLKGVSTPASASASAHRPPRTSGRARALLPAPRVLLSAAAATLLATACMPTEDGPELPGAAGDEREVSFEGGGLTVPGTFTSPAEGQDGTVPGALIISGSGPTDRDGNGPERPEADTNLNLSRVLTGAGVATLRYDKLGSGDEADMDEAHQAAMEGAMDPLVFDEQMVAAYAELVSQPEVDPERTVVVGHSEGALFALRAHDLLDADPALVLAAPPGTRMLDLIDRQVAEQVRMGEAQGGLEEADAVGMLSDARAARAAIRAGEDLPEEDRTGLFSSESEEFLAWIDDFDPPELAEGLPGGTPVLVLWGDEDAQVNRAEVDRLMEGFDGAERVDLAGVDHILREYDDSPGAAALDADRAFSPEVAPAVEDFVDGLW